MSQPTTPLNEQEQQQLVQQIGQAVWALLPPNWQRVRVEYRAAGRHIELDVLFMGLDGQVMALPQPNEVYRMFAQLRAGRYLPDRGTWISMRYEFDSASSTVDFNGDVEPQWRAAPPPVAFEDELRTFPRAQEHIPGWWRERIGLPPLAPPAVDPPPSEGGGLALRTARVYDGKDAAGIPFANRPPVDPAVLEAVLTYLEAAPVVLAARNYDLDEFAPGEQDVPLNFRTDGSWVWAGAVPHYLRKHGLPPEQDLIAHLIGRGFEIPEVTEPAKDLAVLLVTGQ